MPEAIKLWFKDAKIDGPTQSMDYRAKANLVDKVKSLELLDEDEYMADIVRIIAKTSPDCKHSKNSKSFFFVVDEMTDKTLSMIRRYVRDVYKKNARAFESSNNASFYKLFNDISTQLETEQTSRR